MSSTTTGNGVGGKVYTNVKPTRRLSIIPPSSVPLIQIQKNPPFTDNLDETCQVNPNSSFTNYRGFWAVNIILIVMGKLVFSSIPFVSTELSWTLTNLTYNAVSFWMLHSMMGIPFEFNQGAMDHLTMWEQIDNQAQYTQAKKFLFALPIALFLISIHFSRYNIFHFTLNFIILSIVLIAKLPFMHKIRIFGINSVHVD